MTIGFYRDWAHWGTAGGENSAEAMDRAAREAGYEGAGALSPTLRELLTGHSDTLASAPSPSWIDNLRRIRPIPVATGLACGYDRVRDRRRRDLRRIAGDAKDLYCCLLPRRAAWPADAVLLGFAALGFVYLSA
jgi:hypothetical protein